MVAGLIPAHAGSTVSRASKISSAKAHPRSRGEHHISHGGIDSGVWLIPAHAGSTCLEIRRGTGIRAHPRSRGEHIVDVRLSITRPGSSPLTRGAHLESQRLLAPPGLIPAHAGSTAPGFSYAAAARAHPRSRGEHPTFSNSDRRVSGSSPLTRGAPSNRVLEHELRGLIPAHAGSTCDARPRRGIVRAHPRSRGEHTTADAIGAVSSGSSPLTRGALYRTWWV